jgi:hypothetical protein
MKRNTAITCLTCIAALVVDRVAQQLSDIVELIAGTALPNKAAASLAAIVACTALFPENSSRRYAPASKR